MPNQKRERQEPQRSSLPLFFAGVEGGAKPEAALTRSELKYGCSRAPEEEEPSPGLRHRRRHRADRAGGSLRRGILAEGPHRELAAPTLAASGVSGADGPNAPGSGRCRLGGTPKLRRPQADYRATRGRYGARFRTGFDDAANGAY